MTACEKYQFKEVTQHSWTWNWIFNLSKPTAIWGCSFPFCTGEFSGFQKGQSAWQHVYFSPTGLNKNNLCRYKPGFALVAWHAAEVKFHIFFLVESTCMATEETASFGLRCLKNTKIKSKTYSIYWWADKNNGIEHVGTIVYWIPEQQLAF